MVTPTARIPEPGAPNGDSASGKQMRRFYVVDESLNAFEFAHLEVHDAPVEQQEGRQKCPNC